MNAKFETTIKGLRLPMYAFLSDYRSTVVSFIVSAFVFHTIRFLEEHVYSIFLANYYLVFHTIIEFASITMYVATFLVIYYVGDRDPRLRMKVLGSILLFVGFIDFWHTFSYNGMPGLFVPSSIQSATTYWIIGRFGFALGILAGSFIPLHIKVQNYKRWILWAIPLVLSLLFLLLVSFYPTSFPTLFIEGEGLTTTKQAMEYIIILLMIISFINFSREYNRTKSKIIPLFLSALILSIFSEAAFTSYFNVYDIYNLIGHLYKLIASGMIFRVLFVASLIHPYSRLDKAEKEISKYANNLEELVNLRTEEINQANQEMLRDIEYAKTIQKAVMSIKHEQYGNLEVYSEYIPYEKVGGDFYGFKDLSDEHLAFYIGDVAGHGVPAAMMTIFMNQTINTKKIFESGRNEIFTPKEVLNNLYRDYNETDFPLEMYAVMIYGVYNKKTNNLIFSSAGLNTYPLIYKGEGIVEQIEHTGFPICKFSKSYKPDYKDYVVPMIPGNKILFYTDGIIEMSNRMGEPFGEERLIRLFKNMGHLPPKLFSQEILQELEVFTQGVKLNDDVHYLIMEVK